MHFKNLSSINSTEGAQSEVLFRIDRAIAANCSRAEANEALLLTRSIRTDKPDQLL